MPCPRMAPWWRWGWLTPRWKARRRWLPGLTAGFVLEGLQTSCQLCQSFVEVQAAKCDSPGFKRWERLHHLGSIPLEAQYTYTHGHTPEQRPGWGKIGLNNKSMAPFKGKPTWGCLDNRCFNMFKDVVTNKRRPIRTGQPSTPRWHWRPDPERRRTKSPGCPQRCAPWQRSASFESRGVFFLFFFSKGFCRL